MPSRKTAFLSRHRVSFQEARYFVTCTTKERLCGLSAKTVAPRLIDVLTGAEFRPDATLICATVMPDHLHWLFSLGGRLTISQVVAKFKVRTRSALGIAVLEWQVNFFEHRLRKDEYPEDYAFYVFLNPYIASICPADQRWDWWTMGENIEFDFTAKLRDAGTPQREWLDCPKAQGEGLRLGRSG